MRAASAELIALLNSGTEFLMADLLTLTFWDASVMRLTSCDMDIVFDGNTFSSGAEESSTIPTFERGTTRCTAGLEVDTLDLTLFCGQTVTLGGISMARAAINGAFDGCRVLLQRVFMNTWGDTTPGALVLFEGNVAGVDPSSTQIRLEVKSELERLNVQMPRTVFKPACSHILYDAGCAVDRPTYTVTGVATGTPTVTSVPSARAEAADYFRLGVLTMTSGAAAGSRRTVRAFSGGTFTLATPLPVAPAAGDTFSVYPGCDRSLSTCTSKFSNQTRHKGYPWVPAAETAR